MILAWIQNEMILSIVILGLFVLSPILMKRYKAKSRYYMWGVIVIALMIPWHSPVSNAIFEINLQPVVEKFSDTAISEWIHQNDKVIMTSEEEKDRCETSNLHNEWVEDGCTFEKEETKNDARSRVNPLFYLQLIWGTGVMLMGGVMIISHISFMRYSRKWYWPIEEEKMKGIIQAVKRRMQIDSEIEIQYCKVLNTPITVGILKPVILFPHRSYEAEEFEMLLAHELTHYKRKDIWYKLLINVVQILHWYNPMIYLMKSKIYFECEASCDEAVLMACDEDERLQYGEMIIDIIKHQNIKSTVLSSGFFIGKKQIKERLSVIMDRQIKRGGKIMISFLSGVILASNIVFGFNGNMENATISNRSVMTGEPMILQQKTMKETKEKGSFNANGDLAPNLCRDVANFSLEKGDTINFEIKSETFPNQIKYGTNYLTLMLRGNQNVAYHFEINQNEWKYTFTAPSRDNYLLSIRNTSNQFVDYEIKAGTTGAVKCIKEDRNQNVNFQNQQYEENQFTNETFEEEDEDWEDDEESKF